MCPAGEACELFVGVVFAGEVSLGRAFDESERRQVQDEQADSSTLSLGVRLPLSVTQSRICAAGVSRASR